MPSNRSKILPLDVLGIGVFTADAVTASVGNAQLFHNRRQFAAWLGLTLSQYSSGGKPKLGRTTRRGDDYLRTLLLQGAKSVLAATLRQARATPDTLTRLQQRIVSLLLRPCEVLSGIANAAVPEVAHHTLGVLFQHRHVVVSRLT